MARADSADEFRTHWQNHIDELLKLGHSLPDDELDEFINDVESLEEYVDTAVEHSFDNED